MNIAVIGTGYVGTTTALVFAEMGHNVTALDADAKKVERLSGGSLPFYEYGLEELLVKHLRSGNIRFTTDSAKSIADNDLLIICVGTPSNPDGSANLQYIRQVAEEIGRSMNGYKLIVNKSTVPVGTQEKVTEWVRAAQRQAHPFDVASNPEFLQEGSALHDARFPDRVIIGTRSERAESVLTGLYEPLGCPVMFTDPRTAELIKYASNAYLASKISFVNELARLCDLLGVNVRHVSRGIGLDPRIGPEFLHAGIGYGGSCFPKDTSALLQTAREYGSNLTLLEKVIAVNETQYLYLLDKARRRLGTFQNKQVAVLGLSFKPHTDDTREAPSLRLIRSLLNEAAAVKVHDPIAKLSTDSLPDTLKVCATPEDALQKADAVFLCTDWPQYKTLNWLHMKGIMGKPNVFDGRNMLDAKEMTRMGFHYEGIGYR